MATLEKIESAANATPDSGHVIAFFVEENNKLVLKAKKSDGSVVEILHELDETPNSGVNMSINWNFKFVNTLDEPLTVAIYGEDFEEFDDIIFFDANEEVICDYYSELPDIITIQGEEIGLNEYFGVDASGSAGWLGYGNHRAFLILQGEASPDEDGHGQIINDRYWVSYDVYSPSYLYGHWDYFDMLQADPHTGLDIENNTQRMFIYAEVTAIPIDE